MKSIGIIVFALLSVALLSQDAKCQSVEIPDKANTIRVINTKTDLFKFVAQTLMIEGYTIDLSDAAIGIVNCNKPMMDGKINLNIMVADSTINIRGNASLDLGVYGNSPSVVENRGMKGSAARKWWDEMNRVALILGNNPSYFKN